LTLFKITDQQYIITKERETVIYVGYIYKITFDLL